MRPDCHSRKQRARRSVSINSLNGIIGHQVAEYPNGQYGPNELRNLLVQGNTVVMQQGQSGLAENTGSGAVFLLWNNRFEGNHYQLHTNVNPFYWMGVGLDELQWQTYGQDTVASLASFTR